MTFHARTRVAVPLLPELSGSLGSFSLSINHNLNPGIRVAFADMCVSRFWGSRFGTDNGRHCCKRAFDLAHNQLSGFHA